MAQEEVTQRRALSPAEASAHPALARPAISTSMRMAPSAIPVPPLNRIPRASAPPPVPQSETVLTPAPVFEDDVELLEDSGLLVLEPPSTGAPEVIDEVSSSFLIDDEAGAIQLAPEFLPAEEEIHEIDEIHQIEEIHELGSELLDFVETRGEIQGQPQPVRPVSDGPKIRLTSLHEQALANGVTQYSDGVPSHTLDRRDLLSQTLRIPAVQRSNWRDLLRHAPIALALVAGLGAGAFFATQGSSSGGSASQAAAGVALRAQPALAQPEHVQPEVEQPAAEIETAVTAEAAAGQDFEVRPLGEAELEAPVTADAPVVVALDPQTLDAEPAAEETMAEEPEAEELVIAELEATEAEHAEESKREERKTRRASSRRVESATEVPVQKPRATGTADPGVLMLAAKPPCDIKIDGKDTGLSTPQRVLRLAPGNHRITLVNHEHQIRDSFKVSIRSGKKTKVLRDITDKIK